MTVLSMPVDARVDNFAYSDTIGCRVDSLTPGVFPCCTSAPMGRLPIGYPIIVSSHAEQPRQLVVNLPSNLTLLGHSLLSSSLAQVIPRARAYASLLPAVPHCQHA